MKTTLKKLLDRLDAIEKDHEEVGDTDVRDKMDEAVYHAFIVQTPGYTLPAKFGMFESAADAAVRAALSEFIPAACGAGLSTPQDRLAAFQDGSVLSDAGNPYDEYFDHLDSFDDFSKKQKRLKKATRFDIFLSIFLPGWGLMVGLIALCKGESKRAETMMSISGIVLIIVVLSKVLPLGHQ